MKKYIIITLFITLFLGLMATILQPNNTISAAAPGATTSGVRCVGGMAAGFPCNNVHMLSHMPLSDIGAEDGTVKGNDHWGWTDPETGREYVIFGLNNGTSFIDITDRENPVYLGKLPAHDGSSVWHDIKVYQNYAFITADIPNDQGLQVFDLTQLRDVVAPPVAFTPTTHFSGFGPGHNLWLNEESGYLYVFRSDMCSGGIYMMNVQDPLNPSFAGCFADTDVPLSDAECVNYNGPDADYAGQEICFIGSDDNVSIGDVTDKNSPTMITTFTYPGIVRAHQGALTPDHRYWLLSDTMDEVMSGNNTRTYVFDVADLDNPIDLGYYEHATTARDHNVYIIGDTAYQTNWRAGLRILDISMLPATTFNEIGYFDTTPSSDSIATSGSWSNFPWWRENVISVSDTHEGLFVLSPPLSNEVGTFLGGNNTDEGHAIAIDDAGNMYVTGVTQSTVFPTLAAGASEDADAALHGVDTYVAKFSADGSTLEYVFWFDPVNALDEDQGFGIDVDSAGNAYVTGFTKSPDFCTSFGIVPGYDSSYNGGQDAFIIKIKADGSGLDYCTYIGGNDWDTGRAIVVDGAGNATITGGTWSPDFPTSAGAYATSLAGARDSFVLQLDAAGTAVSYSTYLGGTGQEEGRGIAMDANNHVYVTGWTNSSDIPTSSGAYASSSGGGFDAFLIKLDATASNLEYATYLGGTGEDRGMGIALDPAGDVYLTGYTLSADFPTTAGAFDTSHNGNYDGFIAKISPDGSQLLYGTFLGGADNDWSYGIDADATGRAYVTGETWSTDFPATTLAFAHELNGTRDSFVAQLDYAGDQVLYATYLGGSDWETGAAIAADGAGHAFVTGATRSADFPVSVGAYDKAHNGDYDVYVSKLTVNSTAQFCAVPPTVTGVAINDQGGGNVQLNWTDMGVDDYEVWTAVNDPYFAPPATSCALAANCTLVEDSTSHTFAATGDPAQNGSYLIRAVTACGNASTGHSNRTGEFDFNLEPGS